MPNVVDHPVSIQEGLNGLLEARSQANGKRGIAIVESAEELAHFSEMAFVILVGYHKGSKKGGGNFIYQPEGPGLRIGEWVFQPGQSVTPYHFGALEGGWDIDSGEALQRFFDFCATPEARDYPIYAGGAFGTRIPLLAEGLLRVYGFDLALQGLAPMDDVLTAKDCRGSTWLGKISIRVSKESGLSRRTGVNGFRIDNSRAAKFCDLSVSAGSGWAVYFAAGNNNMSTVGNVSAVDMGASTSTNQTHSVASVSYSNFERDTLWQTTTIALSSTSVIPSDAHLMERAFWISSAGEPYKIRSVNRANNTLTVYPMVPDAEQVSGEHQLVYGGGVCCYSGGHTAKARIGHVYPMRSGIGLWLTGQSSANVDGFTGQFNGIDLVLGANPENAFGGSFIGSVYFEATRIADLVFVNQASSFSYGSIFGSCASLNTDKWWSLGYKRTDTPPNRRGRQRFPIAFMNNGELWTPGGGRDLDYDSSRYVANASSTSPYHAQPSRNTTEIHLTVDSQREKFRGVSPIVFHLYGQRGNNGSYHRAIPVTCEEGYTINGKAGPLTLENRESPVTLYALLEGGNNWIVSLTEHQTL